MIFNARNAVLCFMFVGLCLQACVTEPPDLINLGRIQFRADDSDREGLPARYPCSLRKLLQGKLVGHETDALGIPTGYNLFLMDQGGAASTIPVQWDAETIFPWEEPGKGALVWIMDEDKDAGSIRNFDLVLKRGGTSSETFSVEDSGGHFIVRSAQERILQYNYGVVRQVETESNPYDRAAYIHPIWTPKGRVITGDFSPEHVHQRGVFLAYRLVKFGELETDFWGLGESSGRILPDEVGPESVTGPVLTKLTIYNRGEVSGKTHLKEVWGVRIYQIDRSDLWILDVIVRQLPVDPEYPEAPSLRPLTMELEKIHYGGMSFRGPSSWLHREGRDVVRALSHGIEFPGIQWLPPEIELDVVTSEGNTRADGNGEAARWIDYSGPVENDWGGLVMYSHPGNPRHPMALRIHPELPYFSYALTKSEPLLVRSDQSLDQRFRILVHDGRPDRQLNDRIGSDYADPMRVLFEPAE